MGKAIDFQDTRTRLLGFGALVGAAALGLLVRRYAMHVKVTEVEVASSEAMPHAINSQRMFSDVPLQLITSGAGPIYVRSYQVDILNPKADAEALMRDIVENINEYVPQELANFRKTKGDAGQMAVGDEYFIRITGPWNGPVRVIRVTPISFSFVTLKGHLEAGEITFSVLEHPERRDVLRFRIQSWARSSNRITDIAYRILGISQLFQASLWTYFCQKAVERSGGEYLDKVAIMTHKTSVKNVVRQLPQWKLYSSHLERWGNATLNFDINKSEEFTEANGWRIDDYSIGLPSETPGAPVANGSFEAAKQVISNYEFPDPTLITGIFVPEEPLEKRIMVLRARFLLFTFLFGVRISRVIDEVRETEKQGEAYVWGYSYQTLEGHFEMGEITFEIWKYARTGEVRFRVHAYSKPDRIRNPFYRLGFAIFGRSLQLRFARTATVRMQQLVLERLENAPATEDRLETPDVQPLEASESAQDKAEATADDAALPDNQRQA